MFKSSTFLNGIGPVCNKFVIAVSLLVGVVSAESRGKDEFEKGAKLYKKKMCHTCHGPEGKKPITVAYPKLAGQNQGYLYQQIMDIKTRKRKNGGSSTMLPMVSSLSSKDIKTISYYLSRVGQPEVLEEKKETADVSKKQVVEKVPNPLDGVYVDLVEKKILLSSYHFDSNNTVVYQGLKKDSGVISNSEALDSIYFGTYAFKDSSLYITDITVLDTNYFQSKYGVNVDTVVLQYTQDSTGITFYNSTVDSQSVESSGGYKLYKPVPKD